MGIQPCILAIIGAAATQQSVKSRGALAQERLVRCLTAIIRILADPTVALRQLPPFFIPW